VTVIRRAAKCSRCTSRPLSLLTVIYELITATVIYFIVR
jgi:hypothetical protein